MERDLKISQDLIYLEELWRGVSSFMSIRDIGMMEIASRYYLMKYAAHAYSVRRYDKEISYLTYKERFHSESGKPLTDKQHCVDTLRDRGILCCGGGFGFGEASPNIIFNLKEDAESVVWRHYNKYYGKSLKNVDTNGKPVTNDNEDDDGDEADWEVKLSFGSLFDTENLFSFNPPRPIGCSARTLDAFGNLITIGGTISINQDSSSIDSTHITILSHDSESELSHHGSCAEGVHLPASSCYGAAVTLKNGDIIYTGGGETPYKGSEVFSTCYLKRFKIYNALEKCVRSSPKHSAKILMQKYSHVSGSEGQRSWAAIRDIESYNYDPPRVRWCSIARKLRSLGWSSLMTNWDSDDEYSDINYDIDYEAEQEALYDLSTFVWDDDRVPSMQKARCGHCAVATFDDKVIALGGYSGGDTYLNSTEVLDVNNYEAGWHAGPSMHDRRSGAAAVLGPEGRIIVAGGSIDGEVPLDSVEALDPREGKWVKLTSMLNKRGYCGGTMAPGGRFLVSGGFISQTYRCSDELESYDTRADRWTVINDRPFMGDDSPAFLFPSFYRSCNSMFHLPPQH